MRLKYSRNGCDQENPSAPLSAVQFHLRSPSLMSSTLSEETPQPTPCMIPSIREKSRSWLMGMRASCCKDKWKGVLFFEWDGCLVPRDVLPPFH